jgi:phosphoribosyl-ATP pyrophosphohydrolase
LLDVQPVCSVYDTAETVGTDREGSKYLWNKTQEETLEVKRERKFASQQRLWQENKDLFNSVSTGT